MIGYRGLAKSHWQHINESKCVSRFLFKSNANVNTWAACCLLHTVMRLWNLLEICLNLPNVWHCVQVTGSVSSCLEICVCCLQPAWGLHGRSSSNLSWVVFPILRQVTAGIRTSLNSLRCLCVLMELLLFGTFMLWSAPDLLPVSLFTSCMVLCFVLQLSVLWYKWNV